MRFNERNIKCTSVRPLFVRTPHDKNRVFMLTPHGYVFIAQKVKLLHP